MRKVAFIVSCTMCFFLIVGTYSPTHAMTRIKHSCNPILEAESEAISIGTGKYIKAFVYELPTETCLDSRYFYSIGSAYTTNGSTITGTATSSFILNGSLLESESNPCPTPTTACPAQSQLYLESINNVITSKFTWVYSGQTTQHSVQVSYTV
jgi:hypothetical protein